MENFIKAVTKRINRKNTIWVMFYCNNMAYDHAFVPKTIEQSENGVVIEGDDVKIVIPETSIVEDWIMDYVITDAENDGKADLILSVAPDYVDHGFTFRGKCFANGNVPKTLS